MDDGIAQVDAEWAVGTVVAVLGPVSVLRDGALVPVPGRRPRTLLAALALDAGRFTSAASLIDEVWGDALPRDPMNALHTQLSRLRALLPDGALEQGPAGYRLTPARNGVDLSAAEDGIDHAAAAARRGDAAPALALLDRVTALMRGVPGDDLPDGPVRDALRASAFRMRKRAEAVHVDGAMAAGRYEEALPLLRELCERRPMDEPAHAKLMRVLAETGRGNEAVALYAQLRSRLADGLGTDPSEELSAVHVAILRGELGGVPAEGGDDDASATAAAPWSIGLRAEPNALIGRDADLAAVHALVDSSRVVTILGPGGTGKTRLANRVGATHAEHGRVALVELVGVRSGEDVAAAVAGTLGLGDAERLMMEPVTRRRSRAAADPRDRLKQSLASTPTLLILDNCEQVVGACADLVADLTASCPHLTVLTTSRIPLMISAEWTYPLAPLPVAHLALDDGGRGSGGTAEGSPATELFAARARAVRPSVRLDVAAVARLCTALDGLPLAIELAAARVRTMSVEQINARLIDRFTLLNSGDRAAPHRHRTLHAVIDWSWNLLDAREQDAMRRLCYFPGGFGIDTARRVIGGMDGGVATVGGRDAAADSSVDRAVDDAITGLVEQSMLEVAEVDEPVGLRYHMLETVREFGLQLLESRPGERDEVEEHFCEWAAEASTRITKQIIRGGTAESMIEIEVEHENLVFVLRAALESGRTAVVLPVFTVLSVFWSIRGSHAEAALWSERVQAHWNALEARAQGSGQERTAWAHDAAIDTDVLYLALLIVIGYQLFLNDRRAIARTRGRIRTLQRTRPPSSAEAAYLVRLATVTRPTRLGRMFARGARSGDPGVRALAHSFRANTHENAGRWAAARRDATAALGLARQRGDRWSEGMAAQMLGQLSGQAGRHREAVDYYRLAAKVLWEVHAYEESIQMRGFIAAALVGAGQPEAGRREALAARGAGEVVGASAPGGRHPDSQYRAAIAAALAEADLAEGDVDGGVRRYWEAVMDGIGVHGTERSAAVDPYMGLLIAAATCAHAAGGHAAAACRLAGLLARGVVPRLTSGVAGSRESVVDLPVTASVLLAMTVAEFVGGDAAGDDAAGGDGGPDTEASARFARELALAERAHARQDYPSMSIGRWLDAARRAAGDVEVEAARRHAAGLVGPALIRELLAALSRDRPALG
ncbi:BTAD domain-containing putative transcriptional regulator [Tomitella cavernea]|uniref:BTAD domain-containing putative transcriptional regulator n=1 Tax=Tomitella cavernea TaxID=1387982 RepID=UPI00190752AE|nr:BTAD domain-containing putative transcriptional regulator [Tomitella cavernea]